MIEVKTIPSAMRKAAACLKEGPLLIVYKDGNTVRCETEKGEDPYVWRKGRWCKMKSRR
jgi:hypothetical protein